MTFLDLCAGFGGFSLGLEAAGMICKGQVEIDEYCNRVLTKHWPHVPRWRDIKDLCFDDLPAVDLIAGGYPCQPFSYAGKRKGKGDDRHLWPFIRHVVAHLRPSWCLFENVVGHVTLGLDQVLSDLEGEGYSAVTLDVPACGVGAPHIRRRIWIIAHAARFGRSQGRAEPDAGRQAESGGHSGVIFPNSHGFNGDNAGHGTSQVPLCRSTQGGAWRTIQGHGLSESGLGGSDDGLSGRLESMRQAWEDGSWEEGIPRTVPPKTLNRVARCTGMGNAVVPYLPMVFGRFIKAAHYGEVPHA